MGRSKKILRFAYEDSFLDIKECATFKELKKTIINLYGKEDWKNKVLRGIHFFNVTVSLEDCYEYVTYYDYIKNKHRLKCFIIEQNNLFELVFGFKDETT